MPASPSDVRASLVATPFLIALLFLAWTIQETLEARTDPLEMIALGAGSPLLVADGDLHRLLADQLWHSGPVHLGINLVVLALLGWRVEREMSAAATLTLWTLGGIAGSTAWVLGGDGWISIGSSGANFALAGAWWWLRARRARSLPPAASVVVLALFILPALLFPRAGLLSHAGGFVAGLAGGIAFGLRRLDDGDLARTAGGFSAVALVTVLVAGIGAATAPGSVVAVGCRFLEQPDLPAPLAVTVAGSIVRSDSASRAELEIARRALRDADDVLPEDDDTGFRELLDESLRAVDTRLEATHRGPGSGPNEARRSAPGG